MYQLDAFDIGVLCTACISCLHYDTQLRCINGNLDGDQRGQRLLHMLELQPIAPDSEP